MTDTRDTDGSERQAEGSPEDSASTADSRAAFEEIARSEAAAWAGGSSLNTARSVVIERRKDELSGTQAKDRKATDALLQAALALEIQRLEERLQGLYDERDRLLEEMEELSERRDRLALARQWVLAQEEIELDGQGRLTNAQAETAIREYEARTGHSIDRTDRDAVLGVLQTEDDIAVQGFETRRNRLADLNREIDEMEKQLHEARQQRDMTNGHEPLADELRAEDRKAQIAEAKVLDAEREGLSGPTETLSFTR